jgi:phytoene dehydrogenase-like protein
MPGQACSPCRNMWTSFLLAGKNPADYFTYQKLDVVCNYFYEDGTRISAYADTQKFAEEIETQTGEPAASIVKYLANSRDIYSITNHVFLERSLHKLKTYLRWDTMRSIFRFPKIDPFRTMHKANAIGF